MQCKNCGSHYRMRDLACPYCGTENALGRIWQKQRTDAELEYEQERIAAGKRWSPYVYDRAVSRIMIVEAVLLILSILLIAGFYSFKSYRKRFGPGKDVSEITQTLDSFFSEGEYGKFEAYYNDFGDRLAGDPSEREYSQIYSIVHYYNDYINHKLELFGMSDQEIREDEYILRLLLSYSWMISTYKPYKETLCSEAQKLLDYCKEDINSLLTGYLKLTQEETEELLTLDYYYSSRTEWEEKVRERNGW